MLMHKIKYYRELNKDSIEDLSKKIDVNADFLRDFEDGKLYPSLNEVHKICEIYNIEVNDLLTTNEQKKIYKIKNKRKVKNENWLLIVCIAVISIFTITGLVFFIQMTIDWINGGSFF